MCGIAGLLNYAPDKIDARLELMRASLRHRGGDGGGEWSGSAVRIAHERMAVIGLANGAQPIISADGALVLVCNGEIYNYRALKKEFTAAGRSFATESDSEVILHLYEADPGNFLARLDGMFALALFDVRRDRLILARDRFGKKPLFYRHDGHSFAFASEPQALFFDDLTISEEALHHFLALQYVPKNKTIYHEIKSLPPGHTLTFDRSSGEAAVCPRYRLEFSKKLDISLDDAACELRRLLKLAVEKRLAAEVPLGAFLSGGVDSAVIAALMLEAGSAPVTLVSMALSGRYDESKEIAATVAHLSRLYPGRIDHRLIPATVADFDLLEEVVAAYGQPFADASMLLMWQLCRVTREAGLAVALSGDGADELFGGYERYRAISMAANLRFPRSVAALIAGCPGGGERTRLGRLKRFMRMYIAPENKRYYMLASHAGEAERRGIYGWRMRDAALSDTSSLFTEFEQQLTSPHPIERCSELDIHTYWPGDVLTKVDIASMHWPLEVRSPFLDPQVVEFAAALPWEYKQNGSLRKIVLHQAFAGKLPIGAQCRPKRGFGVPMAELLRGAWCERVRELLLSGKAADGGWFDPVGVERLWQMHQSGYADHSYLLFSMAVFELFLRRSD